MITFLVKPDFHRLSKYYKLPSNPDEMQTEFINGFEIELMMCTTDEKADTIRQGLEDILHKYGIHHHREEFSYLALSYVNVIDSTLYEYNWSYSYANRTRELAQFLLAYNEAGANRTNSISLKTNTATAKIADTELVKLVVDTLTTALAKGQVPASVIEFNVRERFFDKYNDTYKLSHDKLKQEANVKLDSQKKRYNEQLVEFCFYLYPYLTNETDIKPSSNTLVSDAQLNLYFDLLCLFEFLSPDNILSEPKDYMRTLLKNILKKNMLVNQGNKLI